MIKIKKGLNLPIAGEPAQVIEDGPQIQHVALLGEEYVGMRPSMLVKEGEQVKKGQALFEDKKNPGVIFTSPASGTITHINRGERRVLQSVVIEVNGNEDDQVTFASYDSAQLVNLTREQVEENLLQSGLWTALRTRPFSHSPKPGSSPLAIFVTAMDTNPLAADPLVVINQQQQAFNDGLQVLSKLTDGKVHICHGAGQLPKLTTSDQLVYTEFAGPHPAGLVGTHIHFLEPVSMNKRVWHLNYQDVIAIGKLFTTGYLYTDRVISLAGPQVEKPRLIRTRLGADILEITAGQLKDGENRIISGSILWGVQCDEAHHYLGRFHNSVAVLREGREKELFGWIMPGINKFTITRTTIGHFLKNKRFNFTTTMNGGERSMVPIGNYERVMPLDIMITHLLRDLLVGDTEGSQALGCLELDEEDLGLCTYVCPAKYEYGPVLRDVLTKIELEG
ncbi:Na(+)-translocating NADH-quinone reductase subunit A [Moellerella wisconsensis]|uniref:Na(+)-translocating NADH-quinone reductase subunit A n=2 Tax=Moellerella wisconsensis TaxID=158849 RepID=A0A9Q8Q4B0_9GAMM|nr:Na(+)-translocating NADH-quinone reductase subunit A [Moellerella wisconsensis]KLN97504.1 Na(+)-translocating NADH-quinone reductase subunit A [Moellerella wisconsensis]UNH24803.1 Na(+)-translocating NADH-quinone reductase subunit A [Moellerella wisconsensis]UNH27918.1 Na(+)-translocating NADH-quinone reductase subunit A [Moellerella wisconsensis]UNH31423.1 Na(+)-translocating NADH-quinone reductase subunit A [Moellerella wisconsensis]UNH39530.1 Na(+)-translocating NADH-quinone reductase su